MLQKNSIKPFWSWNDRLKKEELENQIVQMKENGIDGFFMHARVGLKTPYMGEEWFEMIEACLDKADELDMQAWAYDENGWPSGSADGKVTDLGFEHHQKSLQYFVWEGEKFSKEHILAYFDKTEQGFVRTDELKDGTYVFYYHVNPYYVDVFNKETIAYFLECTHGEYYKRFGERFGTSLKGFFTDEPQFCLSPWSMVFPEVFEATYGYNLIDSLPYLFFEDEGYEAVRSDFHMMVAKIFRESFIKQMYDWCEEHHCKLTGHMMGENTLIKQMNSSNGVMACYEYFHEPGIDHLRRCVLNPILPKQLGSVAAQLGKKTLTETFGLCGWDVSLNELKWIAEWQYLNGATSLCPHLESYSLRGVRKRDYPASYFTQLPWFLHVYSEFAEYFTELGALLDSGKDVAPLLVLHPITSAYILQNPVNRDALQQYDDAFQQWAQELSDEHILHHYGDETIMQRYGSVEMQDGKAVLKVGKCNYQAVLLPKLINLLSNTVQLLLDYAKAGGKVYAIGQLPQFENGRKTDTLKALCAYVQVCEDASKVKALCDSIAPVRIYNKTGNAIQIHYAFKELDDDRKLLYLTNRTKKNRIVTLDIKGSYNIFALDVTSGKEEQFTAIVSNGRTSTQLEFSEYGSAVLMLYESEESYMAEKKHVEVLRLKNDFDIISRDDNAITLDKCIYRIDDGEWQSEIAVINLHNKVLELQKACKVEMKFTFKIAEEVDFESIKLCMEDSQNFDISVNDMPYVFEDCGMFVDHAIRTSFIGKHLKVGENTITLTCQFTQSEELYYAKFTPGVHESILNKLTYDTELENIYLIGNFGVKMEGNYDLGERRCLYGSKQFELIQSVEHVDISDITHQGFWFFTGQMMLSQRVNVELHSDRRYIVQFRRLNAPAARIYVNGNFAGNMIFSPYELDVTELLKDGENEIVIQMLSGNRNLLGPHHKPEGESYSVGPDSFSNKRGWTDDPELPTWTDNYNFVLFGVEL